MQYHSSIFCHCNKICWKIKNDEHMLYTCSNAVQKKKKEMMQRF